MVDYIELLRDDLLEQFKGKKNFEALFEVIGEQFNDLAQFFDDIKNKTSVQTAIGKQLDGEGDKVVLTRKEASMLIKGGNSSDTLDDETYRQRIIYKILKNTCNCTYYDVMKALSMFWEGEPLRYSEDPSYPATIIFDFEATKEAGEQIAGLPFIKAGGVGLFLRMSKKDDTTIYTGFGLHRAVTRTIECNEPVIEPLAFLTDENGIIMTDENGVWLV